METGLEEPNGAKRAGERLDVLVIGGGQAGLAMGYELAQRGLRFQILDAAGAVGETWRSRWSSLKLFTAAQYNHLPGMAFPGAHDSYPGKDDVADFLQAYVARFDLPVRLDTRVIRLARANGAYRAEAEDEAFEAAQVVVATGPFQVPLVPPITSGLDPGVAQLHSSGYRDPDDLPAGRILVVGGANSGQQIALELSASREVELAVGRRLVSIPQRPLGRDLWWWLSALRLTRVTVESRLGRRLSQRDVVIGGGLRELRRHGVGIRPRATGARGRTVTFADGEAADFDAVVWATGYELDQSWIDVPGVRDERRQLVHRRGVTPSPGLYVLGLTWQHTRTSALLGWVGDDAAFLADEIARTSGSQTPHTHELAGERT
jgi:putative flavoprotein involved in K+ transport